MARKYGVVHAGTSHARIPNNIEAYGLRGSCNGLGSYVVRRITYISEAVGDLSIGEVEDPSVLHV